MTGVDKLSLTPTTGSVRTPWLGPGAGFVPVLLGGLVAGIAMVAPGPLGAQTEWEVTAHDVAFEIRNAGLPVRGTFEAFEAGVFFDPAEPASAELSGSIDPASIETGIALRDRHLAGRQFFDVRRYPRITMRSVAIEPGERPGRYRGSFELTVRDVTRRIPVDFTFEATGDRATLRGEITIDRVEYGVGDGGFLLGDDVTVTVGLELRRTSSGAEARAGGAGAPDDRVAPGIEVEYVAHAAFRLRDGNGTELLIDPFASRVWLGYDWPGGIDPDAILVTHPHYDHDAGRFREMPFPWGAETPVIDAPGTHRLGDFTVTGVRGKHADPYGREFGQLNTPMLLEAYGLRIAHLGDNGPLAPDVVEALGRVDVLMIPGDGVYHILSPEETAAVIAELDPRVVIPMHYRHPDLEEAEDAPSDLGNVEPWLAGRGPVRFVGSHVTTLAAEALPARLEYLVFEHAPYVTR